MRKVIAISVVFALIAGAAFAQTAVSGTISVRTRLYSDTLNDVENTAVTNGEVETAYVQLSGQNAEATFGGLIRLRGNDGIGKFHRAFAWWKPIPQLNVFLGQDLDGKFGPYNAWTFFQGQEGYAHDHDWDAWRAAFPGNWDSFGLALSVYPIQGLEIDIVVPIGGIASQSRINTVTDTSDWGNADGKGNPGTNFVKPWEGFYGNKNFNDLFFGSLQLAVVYAIPDIGKVYLNVLGPGTNIFDSDNPAANYGRFGVSFLLTAVQGLDVQVGFSTTIPGEVKDYPSNIALIANYSGDGWGVRFRSRFVLGTGSGAGYNKDYFQIGADIQPWYNFGFLTAYFDIGFISTDTGAANADPVAQLIINPYIRMGFGAGSVRFGMLLKDPNLDNDNDATIAFPLIFGYSF